MQQDNQPNHNRSFPPRK